MATPEFVEDNFLIDLLNVKYGGEAIVYKGIHESHGKVAIKKWHRNLHDEAEKQRRRREVTLLMENPHVNIIEFLGILVDYGSEWIGYFMPYMEMGSLDRIIHNKNKNHDDIHTSEQIKRWIVGICSGLSHLHSKNIIHRDITPSKKSYDEVKLSGFRIAKPLENLTHTLAASRGTYSYTGPEILKEEKYDISADIYSLSITIWEILYRRCWHVDVSRRPTINYVAEFFKKADSVYTDLQNVVNECVTTLENLNVHSNDDESLTQIPFKTSSEKSPEEQTILLLGGDTEEIGDSLLLLENNGQNWKQLNIELPYAVCSHGAQFLNNNLYIFGGYVSRSPSNWTYKLSERLQWEKMADMNDKRSGISNSSVILNNQIWVCGGGDSIFNRWKSVERYDPLTNEWKYMKQMNQCRSEAAAAVVNKKIFCGGGFHSPYVSNSVEFYDPFSEVWTIICDIPMPQMTWGHGAVEMNGHFVIMGGIDSDDIYYNNVWALDTTDKDSVWIEKPSMSTPRYGPSVAKIHDKIFVCGGEIEEEDEYRATNLVENFDGEVWKKGPNMPIFRDSAPAVVIPIEFARYLK